MVANQSLELMPLYVSLQSEHKLLAKDSKGLRVFADSCHSSSHLPPIATAAALLSCGTSNLAGCVGRSVEILYAAGTRALLMKGTPDLQTLPCPTLLWQSIHLLTYIRRQSCSFLDDWIGGSRDTLPLNPPLQIHVARSSALVLVTMLDMSVSAAYGSQIS